MAQRLRALVVRDCRSRSLHRHWRSNQTVEQLLLWWWLVMLVLSRIVGAVRGAQRVKVVQELQTQTSIGQQSDDKHRKVNEVRTATRTETSCCCTGSTCTGADDRGDA